MAQQAFKIEDPEGTVLLVQRIDDVGYTIGLQDADGTIVFRLLDENDRRQLRDFLKAIS